MPHNHLQSHGGLPGHELNSHVMRWSQTQLDPILFRTSFNPLPRNQMPPTKDRWQCNPFDLRSKCPHFSINCTHKSGKDDGTGGFGCPLHHRFPVHPHEGPPHEAATDGRETESRGRRRDSNPGHFIPVNISAADFTDSLIVSVSAVFARCPATSR
ncbi:hypothetical protein J437_LFUL011569 [Ladona fulva]|uniref:Uncharacterized protein n=1 Tax=Ladona fulva TaxID=123851 RepID=A0A8K0P425_LADFU|nr:hypothetical protein J437_LFUL011569 [Ladona fulva]